MSALHMKSDDGPSRKVSSLHNPTVSPRGRELAKLSLGALGVVYGDIGTSPLYALKECVSKAHGVLPTPENILGLLSLVFWSLVFVVVIKYLIFLLRVDNHGEGGVLALLALVTQKHEGTDTAEEPSESSPPTRRRMLLVMVGLFGAALLYGDGVITPAISVLSAVEGLEVATNAFKPAIVPLTCGILIGLFLIQKRGTTGIGAIFGPTMLLWFACLGLTGVPWILERPEVLAAVNPLHAVNFMIHHGKHGFLVLGSVVLVITGGEALYADMGHFGRRAIRRAWSFVVFPGLLLNYFGQGALLLTRPEAATNPFFALVEGPWIYPLGAIATAATIVASQALISGAYSLTQQAIQLGYAPRLTIKHTSEKTEGQIYMPEINTLMMIGCLLLVVQFRSSTALAAAYGIAVTGTMAITSMLFFVAVRDRFGWKLAPALGLLVLFLTFDLAFFSANLSKIAEGGWVPLAIAVLGFTAMTTWKRGRALIAERLNAEVLPLKGFVADVGVTKPHRVKGTAVFMTSTRRGTPGVLLHHFKHNKVLHEKVVILTIATDHVPYVSKKQRVRYKAFDEGFYGVTAHYGFMETPNVLEIMRMCRQQGLDIHDADTSFFLGRETLVPARQPLMAAWRRRLFALLSRNSRAATDFFGLPANRVVELGTQIEL